MKNVLILSGEASGDKHGAHLMSALKTETNGQDELKFTGIGGDLMAEQGLVLLEHSKNMAFLGLWEVITHLGFIREKLKQVKDHLKKNKTDLLILIDYPGFNMKIAAYAKELGIPVVYYILPKVWAWGKNRVGKIRKYVDIPLSILPFEEDFYSKNNIKVHYVGNPSLETIRNTFTELEFINRFGLEKGKKIIGLLPGSRKMEIESLLPIMLETVALLNRKYENIQFIMSQADNLEPGLFNKILKDYNFPVKVIQKYPYDVMKYSHLTMVASGTASLETAIFATPSVVLYKVNPVTFQLAKRVVNVKWISLTNLILNQEVFPEFIQDECNAVRIFEHMCQWLDNPGSLNDIVHHIKGIPDLLGNAKASQNAAKVISEHLYK